MEVRLPNFVVVGAPKCGTTSIYNYLKKHPDVFVPERKELHYFSYPYMERFTAGPGDAYILTTLCKTEAEYASYYSSVKSETAIGDISPSYFYYSDLPGSDLCDRMRSLLGASKIILMTRDPVEKAYSQYMHLVRDARETLDFGSALAAEAERTAQGYSAMWRYAESSLFMRRARKFIEAFGHANVKIINFDDFVHRPQQTMRGVFEFLGVDPSVDIELGATYNRSGVPRSRIVATLISGQNPLTTIARRLLPVSATTKVRDLIQRVNTGAKRTIDSEVRIQLERYFAADREEFEAMLGMPLSSQNAAGTEDS